MPQKRGRSSAWQTEGDDWKDVDELVEICRGSQRQRLAFKVFQETFKNMEELGVVLPFSLPWQTFQWMA